MQYNLKVMKNNQQPEISNPLFLYGSEKLKTQMSFSEFDINKTIDLIKFRISNTPVNELCSSLYNEMYSLKISILKLYYNNSQFLKQYNKEKNSYICNIFSLKETNKVYKTISEILDIYTEYSQSVEKQKEEILVDNNIEFPEYNQLVSLLSNNSIKEIHLFLNTLNSSLDLDFSFLLTDLIISNQININSTKEKEVISFLNSSFISYASHQVFFKLWELKSYDERPLVRNIKIKSAIIQIENNKSKKIEINDFEKFCN